jgi:hypothetical protein
VLGPSLAPFRDHRTRSTLPVASSSCA